MDCSHSNLNIQTAECTLIDKVFALGDYCLSDDIHEHSYGIYKLLDVVTLGDAMKKLVQDVGRSGSPHVHCRSAKDSIDMNALLQEIVCKAVSRHDYEDITTKILFEEVSYETAVTVLQKIADSSIFSLT